nr:hypothetical protein [Pseudomonas aeruginosa]
MLMKARGFDAELQDLIDRLMKFGISKTSMILSTPSPTPPASCGGRTGMADVRHEPSPVSSGRRRDPYLHRRTNPNVGRITQRRYPPQRHSGR